MRIRFWKAEQPMEKHPEVEQEHARLRSLLCRGKYGMYVCMIMQREYVLEREARN